MNSGRNTVSPAAAAPAPTVIVLDDDEAVRGSMDSLFRSVGLRTTLYKSAQDLLQAPVPTDVACLVLDVRLPQLSGLDLQAQLQARGDRTPIIFITGHGDIPMTVRAMRAGAVDFLPKPFRDQDMLDAVARALERDRVQRAEHEALQALMTRFKTLTPRETQVMKLVCSGLMNKQAAGELGLSEITVKLHRASMMKKMGARTVAGLVRMHEALERGEASDHG